MTIFARCGEENTAEVITFVEEAVRFHGLQHIVVASTRGSTGLTVAQTFCGTGVKVVVVTHNVGHKNSGESQLSLKTKKAIEELGAEVLTGTTVWGSLDDSIREATGLASQERLIAQTLRTVGEGVKVCVEICLAATDAGLIPEGENVICVAGTGKGADTAVIARATSSGRFLQDFFIRKILVKPVESKAEMKRRQKEK